MNNNTPMQMVKHYIELLKTALRVDYNNFNVAKSKAKVDKTGWGFGTLGVVSDFILIFKEKNGQASFGFVFDYIDKEKEDWSITINYKPVAVVMDGYMDQDEEKGILNSRILSSKPMSVADFKLFLRSFIVDLKDGLDMVNILKILNKKSLSIPPKFDMRVQVLKEAALIDVELATDLSGFSDLKKLRDQTSTDHIAAINKAGKDLSNTKEAIHARKLEAELAELMVIINQKNDGFLAKHEVQKLKDDCDSYNQTLRVEEGKLQDKIKLQVNKRPAYLKGPLKFYFDNRNLT